MRDDRERLRDILEAIHQIEKYAILGKDRFTENDLPSLKKQIQDILGERYL